jgi:hypothetical protein
MEFMPLGDLESFLRKNDGEIPVRELLWIALHIARGMFHIHSQLKINHNDLASRNVLLTNNDRTNEGKYLAKVAGRKKILGNF